MVSKTKHHLSKKHIVATVLLALIAACVAIVISANAHAETETMVEETADEALSFVYANDNLVKQGETQLIAVGFAKETKNPSSATLRLQKASSAEIVSCDASLLKDEGAVFELSLNGKSDIDSYILHDLRYTENEKTHVVTFENGKMGLVDLNNKNSSSEKESMNAETVKNATVSPLTEQYGQNEEIKLGNGNSSTGVVAFEVVDSATYEQRTSSQEGTSVYVTDEDGTLHKANGIKESMEMAGASSAVAQNAEDTVVSAAETANNVDSNGGVLSAVADAKNSGQGQVDNPDLGVVTPSAHSSWLSSFFDKVCSFFSPEPAYGQDSQGNLVIALDPGHGGYDGGACGNGVNESDVNWAIASYCKEELESYSGVRVVMTRDQYENEPGLSERVRRAVSNGADLFVSIHCNSYNGNAHGAEVWVPTSSSSYNGNTASVGYDVGSQILNQLTALGLTNRGVKSSTSQSGNTYSDGSTADYYSVIYNSRLNGIPGIIVEHAFIDSNNSTDSYLVTSDAGRKQLGVADATGIAQYYGLSKGSSASSVQSVSRKHSIMGSSQASASDLASYYHNQGKSFPSDVYGKYGAWSIEDFCNILVDEAQREGVRAEVVFAQAMWETGWLKFGGDVSAEQCNFAGLGATGGGASGGSFNDWGSDSVRKGLRAQVQHLKAYASTDSLNQECVDGRFGYVTRGIAPNVEDLGGRWATGKTYGYYLSNLIDSVLGNSQSYSDYDIEAVQNGTFVDNYSQDYSVLDNMANQYRDELSDGKYFIQTRLDSNKVLDVSGGAAYNGANVQLYESNNTDAQIWYVSHDENGYVTFKNKGSGKVLDVCFGEAENGANIWQYDSNNTRAQKWIVAGGKIISALNKNFVIDIAAASTENTTNVQLYSDNGTNAQRFDFIDAKAVEADMLADKYKDQLVDGRYMIACSQNDNLVFDIAGGSSADAANVQLYGANFSSAQIWNVSHDEKGYITITCEQSGKALDVSGGNAANMSNIQMYSPNGTRAQKWIYDGSSIISAIDIDYVIDVEGAMFLQNTNIQLYLCNKSAAQSFKFLNQSEIDKRQHVKNEENTIADGVYEIQSMVSENKNIDIMWAGTYDGANAQLYDANGTNAQKFQVSHDAKGYLIFTNVNSGKVLDVQCANAQSGANVWQYTANGTMAQKWTMKDGVITSALDENLALDVSGASSSNGANIQIYAKNGTDAQKFVLKAA